MFYGAFTKKELIKMFLTLTFATFENIQGTLVLPLFYATIEAH